MKQQPADATPPKPYRPPELIVYGDIRDVTKTQGVIGTSDNFEALKTVI